MLAASRWAFRQARGVINETLGDVRMEGGFPLLGYWLITQGVVGVAP